MEALILTGEQVELSNTVGNTVHDSKRVYVCLKANVATDTNAYDIMIQKRLQDTSKPFDAVTNPYNVTVGSIMVTRGHPIVVQKYASDQLFNSSSNDNIVCTPIWDRD